MIKTDENGKELKLFKIGDILSIRKGYDISEKELDTKGEVAYIKAQTDNNGIFNYISFSEPFERGISSVDVGRQGVCFIHNYPFFVSGNNLALIPENDKINDKCLTYLSAVIGKKFKERSKTYGRLGLSRMKDSEIYLPVDFNGDPDWDYMGKYISNIERDYVDSVKSFNDRELRILDSIYADTEAPGEPYEYKEFRVGDVFNVSNLKFTHPDLLMESGNLPYVTRSSSNNGLTKFINNNGLVTVNGGIITLGAETVKFYYQPYNDFVVGNKMYSIYHENLNKNIAMYLITCFEKMTKELYGYNNGLTGSKFKELNVTLPTTPDGSIDWDYMEKYISNVAGGGEEESTSGLLQETRNTRVLDRKVIHENKEYKDFKIGDIFDVINGKKYPKDQRLIGNIPLISTTSFNNGISDHVSFPESSNFETVSNVITIAYSGSVGATYYHYNNVFVGETVMYLKSKNIELTKRQNLFITSIIEKIMKKYSYSNKVKLSDVRNNISISLPINDNGDPDWDYMENFIANIEYKERKTIGNWVELKK